MIGPVAEEKIIILLLIVRVVRKVKRYVLTTFSKCALAVLATSNTRSFMFNSEDLRIMLCCEMLCLTSMSTGT